MHGTGRHFATTNVPVGCHITYIYSYIFFLFIISLGLRPNDVSGSLLDDPMVKRSYFPLFQGTPPAQKLGAAEYLKSLFRPFGASRLDLFDLLAHREGVQK